MATRSMLALASALLLSGCSSATKTPREEAAATPAVRENPAPADESRRLPRPNLVNTSVVAKQLLGKDFMPGGTIGRYRKGTSEYELFVAATDSPTRAAITLSDWRKALSGAKLIPSFGGYFGHDDGVPVFVFSKGSWIAGVKGLPEKEADLQARTLAAQLPQ